MTCFRKAAGRLFPAAILLLMLLALGVGCGDDDDDDDNGLTDPNGLGDIPVEWVGVWEETVVYRDCDADTILFSFTETTTICPDEEDYSGIEDSVGVDCDYSWNGNQQTVSCTIYDTTGTCYTQMEMDYTGSVSGTSYSLSGTMEVSSSGVCVLPLDGCMNIAMSGTRIGDAPDPCDPFEDFGDGGGGGGGGGGDGDADGLSTDITGGATVDYDISDVGSAVVYSAQAGYTISTSLTAGADIYSLNIVIPSMTLESYELSTSNVAGKVQIIFSLVSGGNYGILSSITGSLDLTEATTEKIAGTFSFSGGVDYPPGGNTETFTFSNGTFDLNVDFSGKTGPPVSPERMIRHMRGFLR